MNNSNQQGSGKNPKRQAYIMIGTIVAITVIAGILAYSTLQPQKNLVADGSDEEVEYLKLTSLTAVSAGGSEIGPIEEGMVFKKDDPLLIQANFSNPNTSSADFLLVTQVRNEESQDVAQSKIRAEMGGSNMVLDTLWNPTEAGEYTITVYVMKGSDINRTGNIPPAISVHVRVVQS